MELVIFLEYRYKLASDGTVWTDAAYPVSYWARYLGVFSSVVVVARGERVATVGPTWVAAAGDRVRLHAVPDYRGPLDYLRKARAVRTAVAASIQPGRAFIARVPGRIGTLAVKMLRARDLPFNLEVVGDPHDVFAPEASDHPLRPLFRRVFASQLRAQCRAAENVLYVTRTALQRRYPPRGSRGPPTGGGSVSASDVGLSAASFVASNVEMRAEAFSPGPRLEQRGARVRFLSVGSMSQPYKGHADMLKALKAVRATGVDAELVLVGDGVLRARFERLSEELGLGRHVRFTGNVPAGEAVRGLLDEAHVYLQPSLVEGLPRALVEAMGRGLPCIATRVGGIPELLPEEDLVRPGDPAALAERMRALATDPELRRRKALENHRRALEYSEEVLQPRRERFYRAVVASATRPGPENGR